MRYFCLKIVRIRRALGALLPDPRNSSSTHDKFLATRLGSSQPQLKINWFL